MKRNICVISGSRAEYGLLRPLLEEIKNDKDLNLQLVVTGMHLSAEFGSTYQEIEKDGFNIDEKVDISLNSDTAISISRSMGFALSGMAEAYEKLKPDLIVVLGDRFEIFAAVTAALVARIPVAHINGGELTEGVFDDAMRHSITKMSHLHFTSTKEYRNRVIQLGESPKRVFNVGEIGLDNIKRLKLLSKSMLEEEIGFKFNKHNLLITFHPVTLENNTSREQFQNLLSVLDGLKETNLFFTKANADVDGKIINRLIEGYVAKNHRKAIAFVSMGQLRYLSTLQFVDAVVGNSSSGIVEAPSFKIGTIDIGDRQRGRVRAKSVINCEPTKISIRQSFKRLYSKDFQEELKYTENPYGNGGGTLKVKRILKEYDLSNILKKRFYNIRNQR